MCFCLEFVDCFCCDDDGGVVCEGENVVVVRVVAEVIDVEDEKSGGQCASLRDSMGNGRRVGNSIVRVGGLLSVVEI